MLRVDSPLGFRKHRLNYRGDSFLSFDAEFFPFCVPRKLDGVLIWSAETPGIL